MCVFWHSFSARLFSLVQPPTSWKWLEVDWLRWHLEKHQATPCCSAISNQRFLQGKAADVREIIIPHRIGCISLSLSLSHWFILRSHLHHLHLSTYLQATVGHHVSILPNEAGAMGTPPRPPSIHRPDQYDRAHGTHGRLRKEPRNPVDLVWIRWT